jgi:hypothetical protein
MTDTHTGYGASFAKGLDENIYDTLREILDENPDAKTAKIKRLYVNAVINDPDLNRSFIEAFFVNVYASVTRERERAKERGRSKRGGKASKQRRDEKRKTADKDLTRAVFDFIMPNKKKLHDCTFREVGEFGARFTKLAEMGKPDEIVGEVLTKAQVKKAVLG